MPTCTPPAPPHRHVLRQDVCRPALDGLLHALRVGLDQQGQPGAHLLRQGRHRQPHQLLPGERACARMQVRCAEERGLESTAAHIHTGRQQLVSCARPHPCETPDCPASAPPAPPGPAASPGRPPPGWGVKVTDCFSAYVLCGIPRPLALPGTHTASHPTCWALGSSAAPSLPQRPPPPPPKPPRAPPSP